MTCQKNSINSSECDEISLYINCINTFYQKEYKKIELQLIDVAGYALDLSTVDFITAILYDNRKMPIARYYYPENIITFVTGVYEEEEIDPTKDPWIDDLVIEILQTTISNDSIYTTDDIILNKGKIAIEITSEISNYLMIGNVFIDLRVVTNDLKVTIIKCFLIGRVENNKF